MKAAQLEKLGVPHGKLMKLAVQLIGPALKAGLDKKQLKPRIQSVVGDPRGHVADPYFGRLAQAMLDQSATLPSAADLPRDSPVPWKQWGDNLDPEALKQMRNACLLPVSVAGALMPDAHVGYGLPIGGVLATDNAVIPYAVGVDIACRMKLSILDLPPEILQKKQDWLTRAIEQETRFGMGAAFQKPRAHEVMDDDWSITPFVKHLRDKAAAQLGTSGSGNHFVEFGTLTLERREMGLDPGTYAALLTHSGSRGAGAQIAGHYSQLAMDLHPNLAPQLRHLAWLPLDSEAGQEYWAAMNLMGRYAAANHAVIHDTIAKHLGVAVIRQIENHHNFAWEEEHEIPAQGGAKKKVIVHRKGATPAGKGVMGIIPGSMASPGYVVRGRGVGDSLESASHGAGRAMSRTKARETYRWPQMKEHLRERGVTVISAGIDEVPFAYKDIDQVMSQQVDLVETIAKFEPKLVKMAPDGEKAED